MSVSSISSINEEEDDVDETENSGSQVPIQKLPEGTPEWGSTLWEMIQGEFRKLHGVEQNVTKNTKSIKQMERKMAKVEKRNQSLQNENELLKEKLLELEYQQKRNNLIFEGIVDSANESDIDCIRKLRFVLKDIPGLDVKLFRIDKCYRLDGAFKEGRNRRLLCTFNWYYDIQCILRNRKKLVKNVYVSKDLPEEWIDRRRILKPIFNAARRQDSLKRNTKLTKDRLVISGKPYTVAPVNNLFELESIVDITASCQHSDPNTGTTVFLRPHSPYSNLYPCELNVDNVKYNSAEQFIQSGKASLFDDDVSHSRIMRETNPYKIKKLGSKVKNFNLQKWRNVSKQIAFRAVHAKFHRIPILSLYY